MKPEPKFWAVIPAAGVGSRMQADRPKQYLPLDGRTVIEQTLDIFLRHPRIAGVVVAVSHDDAYFPSLCPVTDKPFQVVDGGAERCHSVLNALRGLEALAHPEDWVLVHDAARPCLSDDDLERLIETLRDDPVGGILATPVRDTKKRATPDGYIAATVDRADLWRAFTPQMFRLATLASALEKALEDGFMVTDEASALEHAGHAPRLVEGSAENIKITRPEDLRLAEFYLAERRRASTIREET
ncbi:MULTISPECIES: 2-C-methyl-D-erythritol 4-phosphate cytidylyltransferase [unclassified Ectothiorhodospira]|uniref:2-C-methyl-D-erythritol 4-phosphate cytidylyltransferase n=1 Tax=unclassified Ectothiorhodospira TaxID=2684909 RepID=UPI001EE7B365|nr:MULTISPECIES: 2-C-methyl-D-erythritol 4-phosphate cytidylyltransferase [unclassified Ectothiorhodospira]MCG5516230.1 2-C-methyl-D-erythritol 4-phosphate cytidylyltransferase [Ectothiorhodospira sp. 9100]MCG5519617.1 2-C-methyl-D-erythritol 4-phosphate cytidylyltransferase [Ectothiorhodospira sp. 9905]